MKAIYITAVLLISTLQVWSQMLPVKSLSRTSDPVLVSQGESRTTGDIVLQYHIPAPTFMCTPYQSIRGLQTARASISNCPYLLHPGKPEIPRIPVRIILPYAKTIEKITAISDSCDEMILAAPLSFAEQEVPISTTQRVRTEPNDTIYRSNTPYPGNLHGAVEIQKAFGISIAKVDLYPLVYTARSQSIAYHKELSLIIHLKDTTPDSDIRVDVERFKERGRLTEENGKALSTYPQTTRNPGDETYNYIMITSEEIAKNRAVSPNVQDLIDLRKTQGFRCKVMTTEEIESTYSGGASNEKIRNFIKFAYNNWGTKFVTLGGDVNVVAHFPEKVTYGFNQKIVDTDIPFQCLDGESWSSDYEAEVYVGRISAENAQEFSNQIHKIITYETESKDSKMLKTSLGAGNKLDWNNWGARSIEFMYETIFPNTWEHDSIYQQFYDWNKEDFVATLATNRYGNVDHDGHGSVGGTMKFDVGETGLFTNTKYPFLYTLSCQTGDFSEDCIAEHFISEHKIGGYFGGVLNSEVGLYMQSNSTQGSSPTIHRSFWEAFWERDMPYFSQMNAYSHQMNTDRKFTCCTTNYFGDAATGFRGRGELDVAISPKDKSANAVATPLISTISIEGGTLSFHLNNSEELGVTLYTISGKEILSIPQKYYSYGNNSIPVDNFNRIGSGIYLVEIASSNNRISHKVKL